MSEQKLSPMMQQYKKIKDEYQDAILMYRLGDFYEMFFDDALTASEALNLTLTGRNCGLEERAPMCGVPHHSVDSYIVSLVKQGYKVAICEQTEDPAQAKGIVKREITRVYTPGTLDIPDPDSAGDNVYIASVRLSDEGSALAVADITTGELSAKEFDYSTDSENLINELAVLDVKEIIISEDDYAKIEEGMKSHFINPYIDKLDESYYSSKACREYLLRHFETASLIPLDLEGRDNMISALGALLIYLSESQKADPAQIRTLSIKANGSNMRLDKNTVRNLELLETLYDHETKGSLLGVLDKTKTAMGGRLLKSWIKEPLTSSDMINDRLEALEQISQNPLVSNNISNALKNVYDFQRLTARIASGRADARDLIALKKTIRELPDIKSFLDYFDADLLKEINLNISDFPKLHSSIERAITEEPPMTVTEGGIIKKGYSDELDELKASISGAKEWIAGLEASERERTGIKTIKVGYNKVFGYYIDVSKGLADKVPENYIRKQTLVNNERFVTPELKEKEDLVFSAEAKINKLEYEEFKKLRESILPFIDDLQRASSAVATLDVLLSFAKVSIDNNYVRPVVNDGDVIDIKEGRHPAVEQLLGSGIFVSNDTYLDMSERSMLIITGPNMSGKSTYMRQTAVIVLMAQIGCFVPASSAVIGICDRIFTRIGASDNLAYGQSTFYIEMSELAGILRNSTSKSLIILDEIGRGTSTFDGLSIAWATAEYLANPSNRVRTMFATHYHELTELADLSEGICNLSVAVAEDGNDIVFLHNIVEGSASKSYGIHVARIAGVPSEIRTAAGIKLKQLEAVELASKPSNAKVSEELTDNDYGKDINTAGYNELIDKIESIDINNLTPLQAINRLQEIKSICESELNDD